MFVLCFMPAAISNNIKKIREIRNFSQSYMARMLGISQPAYSDIENGKTKINSDKLLSISLILKVDVAVIINFSEEMLLHHTMDDLAFFEKIKNMYENMLRQKDEEISSLKETIKIYDQRRGSIGA